jgi:hypothetical protein
MSEAAKSVYDRGEAFATELVTWVLVIKRRFHHDS